MPPASVLPSDEDEDASVLFIPAPEVEEWTRAAFLAEGGPFWDERNSHLADARLAFLWAARPLKRQGQLYCGTAELAKPPNSLSGWKKDRFEWQFKQWFGSEPFDFLITLWGTAVAEAEDASFCGLILHELQHCSQAEDEFGSPKFHRDTGLPIFCMRGHDAEEFVATVEWFGIGAGAGKTRELVEAAGRAPLASPASISLACGTCAERS
jgi:hypothetical protein